MNKIILIGRITKDPELTHFNEGEGHYCRFFLAVDRRYKNSEGIKEADFIPIRVWSKGAEYVANYVKKGDLLSINGNLRISSYEDKEGNKKYVSEVIAEEIKKIASKKEERAN